MSYILTDDDPRYKIQLDKYSFPFNWESTPVNEWLHKLDPYEPFIHDIFLSCPGIDNYFTQAINNSSQSTYEDKCIQMLQTLKNTKQYKSVITLNGNYSTLTRKQKNELCYKAAEQVIKYDIYGCVVSDFIIACKIHELCPDLILTTSCNYGQYSADQMIPWKKAGVNIINPCRNSGRNLTLLKQFKQQGFKLRVLLNEMCLLNCPYVSGGLCMSSKDPNMECLSSFYSNIFNNSIIIPRWLYILDDVVDIYKLTGRWQKDINVIIKQLEYYILRSDNITFNEFRSRSNDRTIMLKDIPDLLMYCEQKCYGCTICDDLAKKFDTSSWKSNTSFTSIENNFADTFQYNLDEFFQNKRINSNKSNQPNKPKNQTTNYFIN